MTSESAETETYVVYKKRFLILLLLSLVNLLYSFQTFEYTIVANIIKYYYGVSDQAAAFTTVINFITVCACVFLLGSAFKTLGNRFTFVIGSFTMCIATVVKCFSVHPSRFWLVIVGQVLTGICFSLTAPLNLQISRVWFASTEVNRACTVGLIFKSLGTLISFIVPVLVIPNSQNKHEIAQGISNLSIGQAATATIVFIAGVIFFDEKPETPPSKAEAYSETYAEEHSYFDELKQVFNRNFIIVSIVYGFNTGGRFMFNALLNQLLIAKLENNDYFVGAVGVLGTLSRVIICYVTSHYLDKRRKYKESIYVFGTMTFVLLLILAFLLNTDDVTWIIVLGILIGGAMGPNTSTLMNLGAEITYPVAGTVSSAVLVFVSYVFAIVLIPLVSMAINVFGGFNTIISLAVTTIITVVAIYEVKYDANKVSQ